MGKKKHENEKTELEKWFDEIRIRNTNHMDKKGNLTRPKK
jgi:hypothetical protein